MDMEGGKFAIFNNLVEYMTVDVVNIQEFD